MPEEAAAPPRLQWLLILLTGLASYPLVGFLLGNTLEAVVGLLARDPFPEAPPKCLRMRLCRYRFTTPEERERTGHGWSRTLAGEYLPPVTLMEDSG